MELAFLVQSELLEPRVTTGFMQTVPLPLQHTAAVQLVDYFLESTDTRLAASLRCDEDLKYLIETIGPIFNFSAAEFGSAIQKALTLYAFMLRPSVMATLPPLKGDRRETFLTDMIRQMTQLLEPRTDHPNGSMVHTKLLGQMLNAIAEIAAAHQGKLENETWIILIRTMFGSLHFASAAPKTFEDVRHSAASVAIELLIRSRVTCSETWAVVMKFIPTTVPTVRQWGILLVAITRSMTALMSGREYASHVHVRFTEMLSNVRKTTSIDGFSSQELTFVWKKLLGVLGPLAKLSCPEALMVSMEALRDAVLLVGCATYWGADADLFAFEKPQAAGPKMVKASPSTDSMIRLAADTVFAVLLMPASENRRIITAKVRALETACTIFLRRETEAGCDKRYLDAFFNTLVKVADDKEMWGPLMEATRGIYLLNLAMPQTAVSTLASVACSFFFSDRGVHLSDEDDDEDEIKDPASGSRSPPPASGNRSSGGFTQQEIEHALQHLAALYSIVSLLDERGLLASLSAALLCGIESYSEVPRLSQKLLATVVLCVKQRPRAIAEDMATFIDIAENTMAFLRAPAGTYPLETLELVCEFLAWMPPVSEQSTITIVVSLSTFCQSLRRVEGQIDGDDLGSLFDATATALCRIIDRDPSLLKLDAITVAVLRAIDTGLKPLVQAESHDIRSSAFRLFHVLVEALAWPFTDKCSAVSHAGTEMDFIDRAVSIKVFEVSGLRIITALELSPEGSEEEGEVVLVIRDAFGRKVHRYRRTVIGADTPDPQMPVPKVSTREEIRLPPKQVPEDVLRFVQNEPRTAQLVEAWSQSESVTKARAVLATMPQERLQDGAFCAKFETKCVADSTRDATRLTRLLFGDLGLVNAKTRELPFDEDTIARLKGLDALKSRDAVDVPVVFIGDGKASTAFQHFLNGLGWTVGESNEHRQHATLLDVMRFFPHTCRAEEFVENERKAEAELDGRRAPEFHVRVLWDASFLKFNWAATEQPINDLFANLSPQFKTQTSQRSVDICITPMPATGLYGVRVILPNCLPPSSVFPSRWVAPLSHGALVSAAVLPDLVRTTVQHSSLQCMRNSGSYTSPLLLRRLALREVTRLVTKPAKLLPMQTLVALHSGIEPEKNTGAGGQSDIGSVDGGVSPAAEASPGNTATGMSPVASSGDVLAAAS